MDVGILNPLALTTTPGQLLQGTHYDSSNANNPEQAFDIVFAQLLNQGLTTIGSEDGSFLGMKGPWKSLLLTTLSEGLVSSQSIGFGRLVLDSTTSQKPGGIE
ncbi:MAG: hypothetical protein RPU52_11945 [Candidatus Sedimenticola sp. (ex Thyasira tokunagai)]